MRTKQRSTWSYKTTTSRSWSKLQVSWRSSFERGNAGTRGLTQARVLTKSVQYAHANGKLQDVQVWNPMKWQDARRGELRLCPHVIRAWLYPLRECATFILSWDHDTTLSYYGVYIPNARHPNSKPFGLDSGVPLTDGRSWDTDSNKVHSRHSLQCHSSQVGGRQTSWASGSELGKRSRKSASKP